MLCDFHGEKPYYNWVEMEEEMSGVGEEVGGRGNGKRGKRESCG